jgi:DNA/RNA endonuclease YhcR with UshA esterase domain
MRITGIIWAALLMLLMGAAVVSQEKNPPAQQPKYAYDQGTQQTVEGIVTDTQDYSCPVSGTVGSHITLKGDVSTIEVHLAPASFMKQYEITVHKGDRVTVVGSKITFEGKPALIAKTIVLGRDTYNFRDSKGRPLW